MPIVKTLEFIDADEKALVKFEQAVKKKQYKVYAVGEHLLFSFGGNLKSAKNFINEVEENAFDLDIDYAKVKLYYLNPESGQLAISQSALKEYADENDLGEPDEGMPISIVPYLIEYIFDNEKNFDEEIKKMDFDTSERVGSIKEHTLSDSFYGSEDSTSDGTSESLGEENLSSEAQMSGYGTKKSTFSNSEPSEHTDEHTEMTSEEQEQHYPETKNDYLLEKAIVLFDSHSHIRLPQFDEVTNKELQKEIVEAQFNVSRARDIGIEAIYQRLKLESKSSKQAVETHVIKEARKAHENVISKIESNLATDINNLLTENNLQYEKDREAYVQAQIPNIRKKYDAEHYADYQSVLTAEIDRLRELSQREIDEENNRFSAYIERVFKDSDEEIVNSVDFTDIIDKYNKVAEEQKDLLMIHAGSLKEQIGTTMSKIMQERDNLRSELQEVELAKNTKKEQEQEYIQESITEGIKKEREQLIKETQKQLATASENEQRLQQKLNALNATIDSLEEENKSLQREYVAPAETMSQKGEPLTNQSVQQEIYQRKDKRVTWVKLVVSTVLGLGFLVIAGVGLTNLAEIKSELAQGNAISQSRYLAELEANKKYDKVASKMKEFGYKKGSIASMYLDNGDFVSALKTDSGILPDFYTYVGKFSKEKQKEILKYVEEHEILSDKQTQGVTLRLAVLDGNAKKVVELASEGTDKESAKVAIAYLIDVKDFDNANVLLKEYPDEELAKKVKSAQESE